MTSVASSSVGVVTVTCSSGSTVRQPPVVGSKQLVECLTSISELSPTDDQLPADVLENLPVEVLSRIFSHLLTCPSALVACRRTCRRWSDVVDSLTGEEHWRLCVHQLWPLYRPMADQVPADAPLSGFTQKLFGVRSSGGDDGGGDDGLAERHQPMDAEEALAQPPIESDNVWFRTFEALLDSVPCLICFESLQRLLLRDSSVFTNGSLLNSTNDLRFPGGAMGGAGSRESLPHLDAGNQTQPQPQGQQLLAPAPVGPAGPGHHTHLPALGQPGAAGGMASRPGTEIHSGYTSGIGGLFKEQRLRFELQALRTDPVPGIEAKALEGHGLTHWLASIRGPACSPYEGGVFYVYLKIPPRYPIAPPVIRFLTKIFHPNISRHGDISKPRVVPWESSRKFPNL